MFYLDTSITAAYYCPEALSKKAEAFVVTHSESEKTKSILMPLSSSNTGTTHVSETKLFYSEFFQKLFGIHDPCFFRKVFFVFFV